VGLNLDHNHIRWTRQCATSQAGIFAIGDIAAYPGKLKLILAGFSEAALAAHASTRWCTREVLHFEYSTTSGVPQLGEGGAPA